MPVANRPEIGTPAPPLAGFAASGEPFDLARTRVPTIVEFHRGTWWPNCAKRIAQLRERHETIRSAGLEVVVVLCQKPESVTRGLDVRPVPFPIVPDEDRSIARRWGVYQRLSYDAIHIARPATFVVDAKGVVRYARVSRHQGDPAPIDELIAAGRAAAADAPPG